MQWLRDLQRLLHEQKGCCFTTMFDLYGLPDDFPELAACSTIADTASRASALEDAMARAVGDRRLTPYLRREFEALVLGALDHLGALLDGADLAGLDKLKADIAGMAPEEVNDGPETAPSKRLQRFIPAYRKTLHGPLALESATLAILHDRCPRFGRWVARLEELLSTVPANTATAGVSTATPSE